MMMFDVLPRLAGRMFRDVISTGSPTGVYLTFDDGPDPKITPQILKILNSSGCLATFFCSAPAARKNPAIVASAHRAGHLIASHGDHHKSLMLASLKTVTNELIASRQTLAQITGESPLLYRPPYGRIGPSLISLARQLQLKIVLWSVSPADWRALKPDLIIKRVITQVRKGSIILLHDHGPGADNMLRALPELISELRKRGFEPQPLNKINLGLRQT